MVAVVVVVVHEAGHDCVRLLIRHNVHRWELRCALTSGLEQLEACPRSIFGDLKKNVHVMNNLRSVSVPRRLNR